MILRKQNVVDYEQVYREAFHYDFVSQTIGGFQQLPPRMDPPQLIEFCHDQEQKRLFGSFNPGRAGAARTLAKLRMSRRYRTLRLVESDEGIA